MATEERVLLEGAVEECGGGMGKEGGAEFDVLVDDWGDDIVESAADE